MTDRVEVFLDYQNVHLAAHECFAPRFGVPVHQTLVHPLAVAERIVEKRKHGGLLQGVRVFRGRPNPEHEPTPAAANDAQSAAWSRDPRVTMIRRPLNYRGWPEERPREKGVDVALAISLVKTALRAEYDVAVVFTSDTDLLPAIEMAFRETKPKIEIAAWTGKNPLWFPDELKMKRYLPYCHFLSEIDFEDVRDRTKYV
ncbi:NYN domain-containing protein [Nonomuraea wenchangensis]